MRTSRIAAACLFAVLLLPMDALAILDGNETDTCDWPSVVYLKSRAGLYGEVCTGVYRGLHGCVYRWPHRADRGALRRR